MPCLRFLTALLLSFAFTLMTGCGVGTPATAVPGSMTLALTGHVHGGQQPVVGAHVHIFQATYSVAIHSTDLIEALAGGVGTPVMTTDSLGYYVATGPGGDFSITGDYVCGGTGPVYLLATQGNPGLAPGTNNPDLALLSVVADGCGSGGTLSPTLDVDINELTTVAGVYALSGYLSAPNALLYSGISGIQLPIGLTHAADTALALVNLSSGTVNATTASGGTVPAAAITSLANSIASCINSDGTGCSTLFAAATSDGTSTGTQPTDTATALLNIAHHPAANVATLYGLANAQPPFGGGLTTQPNDFTLAVAYGPATGLVSPSIPAVDAGGNVWFGDTHDSLGIFNEHSYTISELSPLGAQIGFTSISQQPTQAAIDPYGNAWFAVRSGGVVDRVTPGTSLTPVSYSYNGTSSDDGHQIAIDQSGDVFVSDNTTGGLFKLNNSGTVTASLPYSSGNPSIGYHDVAMLNTTDLVTINNGSYFEEYTSANFTQFSCSDTCNYGGLYKATALAVDGAQNTWALNANSTLTGFLFASNPSTTGSLPNSPYSGGGLNTTTLSPNQPYPWLAIDGANTIWISNYTGTVSAFSNAGVALSPASGLYGLAASCPGQGAAIDGSGNLWVACDSAATPVLEYIGLATPVTTPLLPGNFGVKP